MEDEAQKMLALKKAYADIILNTVKEAAARVMESERKALRFQQDLCSVKDEALRMLLRLKNMVDSKMKEVEIASLSQSRKVEELDAQLHEAEDVITDLRMQLKRARYQLEKVKNNQVQPSEGKIMNKITFCSEFTLEPNPLHPSTSEPQAVTSNWKNMNTKQIALDATCHNVPNTVEQSTTSQVDTVYSRASDFTSTLVRIKETELYSNSCIQRTHALERNFLDCKLPLAIDVKDKQVLGENGPLVKKRDKEGRVLSTKTGKKDMRKNVLAAELKRSVKFHALRTRKSRFGKYKTGSCRLHGTQLVKFRQLSSIISLCGSHLRDGDVRSNKKGYGPPSLMADSGNITQDSCMLEGHESRGYKGENEIFNGGKIKGKIKRGNLNGHSLDQLIKPCNKSSVMSQCRTSINLVNGNMKSGEYHSSMVEHENKIKQLTLLDPGFTLSKSYVNSTSASTNITPSVRAINRPRVVENASDSNGELMTLPMERKSDAIGTLIFSGSQLNSEMNTNTKYEKIYEVTNNSHCQEEKKTLVKYALQRKCKEDARSTSDEKFSPERTNGKRKLGCETEFERSVSVRESSRESRQLSQVARQLISLSGKRRW